MSATAAVSHKPLSVPRMGAGKILLSWIGVTLIAFVLAGYAAWGIGGHVDGVGPALIGGATTGAGIGFVQWFFLRRDLGISPVWILGTSVALAIGLRRSSATRRPRVSLPSWVPSQAPPLGSRKEFCSERGSRCGTRGWPRCRRYLRLAGS